MVCVEGLRIVISGGEEFRGRPLIRCLHSALRPANPSTWATSRNQKLGSSPGSRTFQLFLIFRITFEGSNDAGRSLWIDFAQSLLRKPVGTNECPQQPLPSTGPPIQQSPSELAKLGCPYGQSILFSLPPCQLSPLHIPSRMNT